MSVLFLRRRQPRELAHAWQPCSNGCVDYHNPDAKRPVTNSGRSSAMWEAELMGVHAAWLCEGCQRLWRSGWPAAGGREPRVDGRRGASFGNREAA